MSIMHLSNPKLSIMAVLINVLHLLRQRTLMSWLVNSAHVTEIKVLLQK